MIRKFRLHNGSKRFSDGELRTRNANTKYKIFGAIIVFTNLFMATAYNSGMYKSSQFVTIFCIVNMTLYLSYYYFMKV